MATVLVTNGKTWMRDALSGTSVITPATADFVGWGKSLETAVVGDTSLSAEASTGISLNGEVRELATRTLSGTDVIQWVASITANGDKTIAQAANFTGAGTADAGVMVVEGDFASIALLTNDIISFTINLQVT